MTAAKRLDQVNALLQSVIGNVLPAHFTVPGVLATVSDVQVSPDLRECQVWITLVPDSPASWAVVEAIKPSLQEAVASKTSMKFTPRLRLRHDTGAAHARHIEDLLRDLP